ncbi:MAG: GTP-binding protein [Verrucomicrobiota bacterium]|nr:GTP-binding protein [Verrucomicrobiota bacterium]
MNVKEFNKLSHGTLPRMMVVSGFPDAGKTTAIGKLAAYLKGKGSRVGIITNDQGTELVDTVVQRNNGFETEEVLGGGFASRGEALNEALRKLTEASNPDLFIAEPVGSSADLVASLFRPLERARGRKLHLHGLSVLIDPAQAMRVFGLDSSRSISEPLSYLYRKQLEEADFLVINKMDLHSADVGGLKKLLAREYPQGKIFEVSAKTGAQMEPWFEAALGSSVNLQKNISLDYDLYGEGEMLMGWLNARVELRSIRGLDSGKVLQVLAEEIQFRLQATAVELIQLKMALSAQESSGKIAVARLGRNDSAADVSDQIPEPVESGRLILNLRAETAPETLHKIVTGAMKRLCEQVPHLFARMEHIEHFRPARSKPVEVV